MILVLLPQMWRRYFWSSAGASRCGQHLVPQLQDSLSLLPNHKRNHVADLLIESWPQLCILVSFSFGETSFFFFSCRSFWFFSWGRLAYLWSFRCTAFDLSLSCLLMFRLLMYIPFPLFFEQKAGMKTESQRFFISDFKGKLFVVVGPYRYDNAKINKRTKKSSSWLPRSLSRNAKSFPRS